MNELDVLNVNFKYGQWNKKNIGIKDIIYRELDWEKVMFLML